MVEKNKLNEFLDASISSGCYVETGLNLPHKEQLAIEDVLDRYNDATAKTKIRKIIKQFYLEN